jgi:sugar phosphate isomerase/epimerase
MALAAELGYNGVELHLRHAEDIDRADVRQLAAHYDLRIPALGTGLAAGLDGLSLTHPDPTIRRQAVERVLGHIDLAAYLNSHVIIGSLSGRVGSDPGQRAILRTAALECLHEICSQASIAGVTVLLEPLNRYECDYLNTVRDVLDVIDELGMPNLRVLADTFHMNIEEVDLATSVRLAGDRLGHVHLADSNRRAAGYGHLDIAQVLRTLQGMDYQGYISFEVFPLPNARQASETAIRTVKQILAQI